MTFLRISRLTKRFGAVVALDGIDLDVERASRTAIFGPSGSGKTTLLRLIAGFDVPDTGSIVLDGETLADAPASVPAHKRGIGFVPQDGALFPHLSVADNIGFGLERRMPGREARIAELIDMVELDAAMVTRRPHELSGGQQQRVALARALARKPKLMLFDEPFSALDMDLREAMRNAVAGVLAATGITALLVTHDQAEALSFADRVAVFDAGRLKQVGDPRDLYMRPRDPHTARFLGDAIILPAILRDGWAECALGRVATDAPMRSGSGEIILRPEQLRLARTNESGRAAGQVTHVEFGGALCRVHVAMDRADLPLIMVKSAGADLPNVGDRVQISAVGVAHVFTSTNGD
ncbi:MAG: ABC transporter ATP-binding protein [Bauldia sp.]